MQSFIILFTPTLALLFGSLMDKFIIKRPRLDIVTAPLSTASTSTDNIPIPAPAALPPASTKISNVVRRYNDDYIKYGFICVGNTTLPIPQCVVCGDQLSNASMVPNKLKRHLEMKHHSLMNKDAAYFKSLISNVNKAAVLMEKRTKVSDRAMMASYKVAEIIAKSKKPHTLAEDVILPACKEVVAVMLDDKAVEQISKVPLSNNTIARRIADMSADIENNVLQKISNMNFSLQVDESTDISSTAQLLAFIRFYYDGGIIEQFFFCHKLKTRTTGQEIFQCVNTYFENNTLSWKYCIALCTDGAPSMTGRLNGFVTLVREKNPEIVLTHCFLHREALMMKTIGPALQEVLNEVVKMVNYIKSKPMKSRIFAQLCIEMESPHQTLLMHTEVRWLSRGKVLVRVYELRNEMAVFFEEEKHEAYSTKLRDSQWCIKLAYLADIFEKFNTLNKSMQGKKENIITSCEKLNAFFLKLCTWRNLAVDDNFEPFPLVLQYSGDTVAMNLVKPLILNHLEIIDEKLAKYFPSVSTKEFEWVLSPFSQRAIDLSSFSLIEKEELIDMTTNSIVKNSFDHVTIDAFWYNVSEAYPTVSTKAMNILLPFSTSYLCELAFSSLTAIKNKQRERLVDVDSELRVCLSSISPRLEHICKKHRSNISH